MDPPLFEQKLLLQSLEKNNGFRPESKEPCSYLSKYGSTLAMSDIAGRTAKEVNWYSDKQQFVCLHCLMPSYGFRIPYPLRARKSNKSGVTQWIVRSGSFGSVGCAIQFMSDHRHTFLNETAGLLISFLIRVYKVNPGITLNLPKAPSRSDLPPFRSDYLSKGEKTFDGLAFHRSLSIPMQVPSQQHHHIVEQPCTVLIDTHVSLNLLGISAQELKQMFPNFYMRSMKKGQSVKDKPKPVLSEAEKKPKVSLDAFLPEKIIL